MTDTNAAETFEHLSAPTQLILSNIARKIAARKARADAALSAAVTPPYTREDFDAFESAAEAHQKSVGELAKAEAQIRVGCLK